MYIFSLDEYGDFEGINHTHEPLYLAGVIFDDKEEQGEEKLERNRIRAYYEQVITDAALETPEYADFSYPESLHSNGNKERDYYVVRNVKEKVRKSISEFIRKGTYNGAPLQWMDKRGVLQDFRERKGEYHLFAIIKSAMGITGLLKANAGIFSRDDYASNLYLHMAGKFVSRLLFSNPVIPDLKKISLNIATRSSSGLELSDPLVAEYRKQGYRPVKEDEKDPSSKVYFTLTNPDVYRSLIIEEMLDTGKTDLVIEDFRVMSILYRDYAKQMEFLYLADSICSLFAFDLEGSSEDEWLLEIAAKAEEVTGRKDNLIFGYDEIDILYERALHRFQEGNLYEALSIIYEADRKSDVFADYYERLWLPRLEQVIIEDKDIEAFSLAVQKLRSILETNSYDQEKNYYILKVLEQKVPYMEKAVRTESARRVFSNLYDAGVSLCGHIGDSEEAEAYFRKCTRYASLFTMSDYLNTRNKMVVYSSDAFKKKRALEIANDNLLYQDILNDLRQEIDIPGFKSLEKTGLARAFSQRGQAYAFLRDSRAESDFREAMAGFGDDEANVKITQSYLLHYYLDTKNREAYTEEAVRYFGGEKEPANQLKYLLTEGAKPDPLIHFKYGLYVFVRGMFTFFPEEMSYRVWRDLNRIESLFSEKLGVPEWILSGHPAELIFKYMALMAFRKGEDELGEAWQNRIRKSLYYHGPTEEAVMDFGDIEIAELRGDKELRDRLSEKLADFMTESFEIFSSGELKNSKDLYESLKETMTFMHH